MSNVATKLDRMKAWNEKPTSCKLWGLLIATSRDKLSDDGVQVSIKQIQ